ncbi:MAG: hypothetical protein KAK04_12605, partial [Cyclobacteriaceae bacterium]|nr:hypothetical protein [Cyclobacteriaceae bacterium]
LKKSKSIKIKKSKKKDLKEKQADTAKKAKKVSIEIKGKMSEIKKAQKKQEKRKSKAKKKNNPKTKEKAKPGSDESTSQETESVEGNADEIKPESPATKKPLPISIDFNAKDAISYLRKLPEIREVELFIRKDERKTVMQAAASRKNAIERRFK